MCGAVKMKQIVQKCQIICLLNTIRIHDYLNKYFKKPRLQKQPIFIFGNRGSTLMQQVLLELYKYQQSVNTGLVGTAFLGDSFINNTNCPTTFSCKISLLKNITVDILEKCNVNQLYFIGRYDGSLDSANYSAEELDIPDINTLRYLVGLTRTLEV